MNPTPRQKQILDFISRHLEKKGFAPSIQEICDHFGLGSTATVHKHLKNLADRGLLHRESGRSRAMEMPPVRDPQVARETAVPLLGQIAAGIPIEAIQAGAGAGAADEVQIPADWFARGERFALRVRGDSMIDAHIEDGDIVVIQRRETARDGETVVALVDGADATLKVFRHAATGRVRLEPRNRAFDPLVLNAERVQIQGVVVGVLRRYRR
jgi:repressor LexA